MKPDGRSEREVELSVRAMLYGERDEESVVRTRHRPPRAGGSGAEGRLVGERYRLLAPIGSGAMADVYRARDERLRRDVAVKLISERLAHVPTSVRRFRREAELAARLTHPNVVAILDAGVHPRDYIVMELVDGVDVGRILQREGPLLPAETLHIVAQLCDALEHAHTRGVIHNDLSPRNVLIDGPGGVPKLADFGIATDPSEAPEDPPSTVTGTPGYIAPELLEGAPPSPRSDLYSLGALAYRLLVGLGPRTEPLADARPTLPGGCRDAIERARSVEPSWRQDSIADFRAQLVGGHTAVRKAELPKAA